MNEAENVGFAQPWMHYQKIKNYTELIVSPSLQMDAAPFLNCYWEIPKWFLT